MRTRSKTQAKNELLAKQKVSANMVASKSDKVFFKKNKFKKKNQNSKNLNVQKKRNWQLFQLRKQGHFAEVCKAPKKKEKKEGQEAHMSIRLTTLLLGSST